MLPPLPLLQLQLHPLLLSSLPCPLWLASSSSCCRLQVEQAALAAWLLLVLVLPLQVLQGWPQACSGCRASWGRSWLPLQGRASPPLLVLLQLQQRQRMQ